MPVVNDRVSRYLLVLAFAGIQGVLWTGENGILDYVNLGRDIAEAEARNDRLASRNQRLVEDVVDLKSRDEAVEELARNRLGMIRDGELFYQVIERRQ